MDREAMLRRAREATDAWNRHDAAAVAAFAAEEATARDVGAPEPIRGRAAIQANVQAYMTAFPDLHIEVVSATCDGERVVQEWVATGTHEGRLMTLEPTHRRARTEGCTVTRFGAGDEWAEAAMYWSPLALLMQLGAVPDPAAAHA